MIFYLFTQVLLAATAAAVSERYARAATHGYQLFRDACLAGCPSSFLPTRQSRVRGGSGQSTQPKAAGTSHAPPRGVASAVLSLCDVNQAEETQQSAALFSEQ